MWLRTLLLVVATLSAVQGKQVAVLEPIPLENIQQGRQALEKWEQQASSESGVMNIILGNTCFTTAITQLKQGCTKMDGSQRCWLAIQFTMCFQRASGFKVVDCPSVCPRYRRLQDCVESCTAKMDSNTYNTYTHFFSDVFNMCLFLQTQSFQEFTTALVQDMHLSTAAANASLANIRSDIQQQQQSLMESYNTLKDVQKVQSQVHADVHSGLLEVQRVGELSLGIQSSVNHSMKITESLAAHQLKLLDGFTSLEQQQQQHISEAAAAWQQMQAGAAAMEQRQVRYEALQAQLLNASEGLLTQQQGMSSLLELLLHYQHTGSSILNHLYATSTTIQDLLFYVFVLSVPLLFFTHPPEARLLLLLSVLLSWVAERSITQQIMHGRRAFTAADSAAAAASGGALSASPGRIDLVKLVVRSIILGGSGCFVLWWLFVKEAARKKRKEELFEALREQYDDQRKMNMSYYAASGYSSYHPQQHQQPAAAGGAAGELGQQMMVYSPAVGVDAPQQYISPQIPERTQTAAAGGGSKNTQNSKKSTSPEKVKPEQALAAAAAAGSSHPQLTAAAPHPQQTTTAPTAAAAIAPPQHHHQLMHWLPMHHIFQHQHHSSEQTAVHNSQNALTAAAAAAAGSGGMYPSPHPSPPQYTPSAVTSHHHQQHHPELHHELQQHAQLVAQGSRQQPTAAAEDGPACEMDLDGSLQQQQELSATTAGGSRRRRSTTAVGGAAQSQKPSTGGKRGRTAVETAHSADGVDDGEDHALKKPAGTKTRRRRH